MTKEDEILLYAGWVLLLITFVFNVSLMVCFKEDIERLEKENTNLKIEKIDLKNREWYCDQITYILENRGVEK